VVNRKAMTMFKAGAAVGAAMFVAACASPADANDNYDLFTAVGSSTSSSYNEDDYISGGDREGATGNGVDPDDDSELDNDGSHDESDSDAPENREFTLEELRSTTGEIIASLRPGNVIPIDEKFHNATIQTAIDHGLNPDETYIPTSELMLSAQNSGVVFYHTNEGSIVIDPNDPPQFVIDAYARQLQAIARGENVPFHPRELAGHHHDSAVGRLPVVLISGSQNTTTDRSSGMIFVDRSLPANTAQQIKDMGQVEFARANPNVIVITEQGRLQ